MFIKKLTKQVIHTFDHPVVETKAGKLRGLIAEDTYIFRGVKYATAKRYHMPQPVEPWEGIRNANVYDYVCPELGRGWFGGDYVVRHVFYPQDEACLSLNIWTQCIDPKAKKPVLFWLHGGGFESGSGIEHYAYDGEEMSKFGDVVVVTVNHRLNVLGYLDLSAYGEKYAHSGNLGQADIVAALKWVRDNIAAFGGDPENVTIFGQSGGGGKVMTLMQMPSADGLYHRAIVMSGVMGGRKVADSPTNLDRSSWQLAALVLKYAGIAESEVEKIETIPYHELAEATNQARAELAEKEGRRVGFSPVADGEYYVCSPFDVGFRKETSHIPLMVGSVITEFSAPLDDPRAVGSKYHWPSELIQELLQNKYGDAAQALTDAFRAAYPGKCDADLLFVDSRVRKASMEFAQLHALNGLNNTYNYLYCLELPFNEGTIPAHNCDIPYFFHNAQYLEAFYIPGVSEKVQDMMCGAFVNFARSGNPNGVGIPEWTAVSQDNHATMLFDQESRCAMGHDRQLMELMPDVPYLFGAPKAKK